MNHGGTLRAEARPEIRAVVFDLDGLMFNTEEVFRQTGTEVLRRRGKDAPHEVFARMMGRRAPEAFAVMIEMMELTDSIDELRAESEDVFRSILDDVLAPMPGLFTLLAWIEEARLAKGVATSSGRGYLEELLSRYELSHRFDVTLTAEDVTHGKPHPEIYQRAAERLGVQPRQMLVLEDSEAGTQSAAAAGACVVSVPHPLCQGHDYSGAQAIAARLDDEVIRQLLAQS